MAQLLVPWGLSLPMESRCSVSSLLLLDPAFEHDIQVACTDNGVGAGIKLCVEATFIGMPRRVDLRIGTDESPNNDLRTTVLRLPWHERRLKSRMI
jgi:hypothetical protein